MNNIEKNKKPRPQWALLTMFPPTIILVTPTIVYFIYDVNLGRIFVILLPTNRRGNTGNDYLGRGSDL